jgi:hypothetical protein
MFDPVSWVTSGPTPSEEGSFQKVFEQRFYIGQVIVRNNHMQFRVDKEAQTSLFILKHKQDYRIGL